MELKREILYIAALLVLVASLAAAINYFSGHVESADAGKFVMEDLKSKYPSGDIEILETKEKWNDAGQKYFEVKAKATEDFYSACPKRSHIYYNYPLQNFVPAPEEKITSNCAVCASGTCVIDYPEEATIASHTFSGTSEVALFLSNYPSAVPSVRDLGGSWKVTWDSSLSPAYYEVGIARDGTIVSVNSAQKAA